MSKSRIKIKRSLHEPLAETGETFMRAGDDLHADDLADLGSGGGTGVHSGFHAGDIALEEGGDVAGADFFPAGERDVCGLEPGVNGFEERTEALALDHSDSLVCHSS